MRFLTIAAAVFATSVASEIVHEFEHHNHTIVIPVHVTETTVVTEVLSTWVHAQTQSIFTKNHTIHHAGFKHKTVTGLPAIRNMVHTKGPKDSTSQNHHTAVHSHSVKSHHKHNGRDAATAADSDTAEPTASTKKAKKNKIHKKQEPAAAKRGWSF